jgi:isopenicillin-N N-acyltransferase-like protein
MDQVQVLSVAGCVGMMGVNQYGAAVVVNNLTSNDAQIGILWPVLVRAMLDQPSVHAMADVLRQARLSSGHNYMLADRHGCQNWETSGHRKKMTWHARGDGIFFHTNHYLDPDMRDCEGKLAAVSTTHDRYVHMEAASLAQGLTSDTVVGWLSSHKGAPRSICSHMGTDDPDASKTCGGVVADLGTGDLHAWRGCLHEEGNAVVHRSAWEAQANL